MSNPDTAVALYEFPEGKEPTESIEVTAIDYEKQVVDNCNDMEFDGDGKWQVPDDMSPDMQFAVNSERRRRDTQSAQGKTQQQLKASEARNTALTERLESTITPSLTEDEIVALEELKEHDPEAWRAKLNEYETAALDKHYEDMETIDSNAGEAAEIERRTTLLKEFTDANPELAITDEVFFDQLPRGLTDKLESGDLAFEDFLSEAKDFLSKGKTTKREADDVEPNLGKSSGSSTPAKSAIDEDIVSSYENEIY